jgi:hypothetical protein
MYGVEKTKQLNVGQFSLLFLAKTWKSCKGEQKRTGEASNVAKNKHQVTKLLTVYQQLAKDMFVLAAFSTRFIPNLPPSHLFFKPFCLTQLQQPSNQFNFPIFSPFNRVYQHSHNFPPLISFQRAFHSTETSQHNFLESIFHKFRHNCCHSKMSQGFSDELRR